MKRTSIFVVLAAVLFSPGFPLCALAYASMAIGDVTVAREDGSLSVSFSATSGPGGSVSGQIHLYDATPLIDQDVDGTGDSALAESPAGVATQAVVNCLVVDGGTAIVGGEVTHSNVKRYLGKQVLLFVAEGDGGRLSRGFYDPRVAPQGIPYRLRGHSARVRRTVARWLWQSVQGALCCWRSASLGSKK